MYQYSCSFSGPRDFQGLVPTSKQDSWNYSSTTCTYSGVQQTVDVYSPTTTISGTSSIQVYGSISSGEIIISILLFLLVWVKLLEMLARGLSNVNTKKTFLGYSTGDVEIRKDY